MLAMEFGPLVGKKNNDSIVNLAKCKNFAPPIDVGDGFARPPTEKCYIKKVIGNLVWEISVDDIFLGNAEIFGGNA